MGTTTIIRDVGAVFFQRNLILERLPLLSEKFEHKGLNANDIDVITFVGHGTSSGHTFSFMERWIVWLPVETYPSSQAVDFFVSHEIAHALHYHQQPDFYV